MPRRASVHPSVWTCEEFAANHFRCICICGWEEVRRWPMDLPACIHEPPAPAPHKAGIYRITVGGQFYIGEARDIHERWVTHQTQLAFGAHTNHRLQATWDAVGPGGVEWEVLDASDRRYGTKAARLAAERAELLTYPVDALLNLKLPKEMTRCTPSRRRSASS